MSAIREPLEQKTVDLAHDLLLVLSAQRMTLKEGLGALAFATALGLVTSDDEDVKDYLELIVTLKESLVEAGAAEALKDVK